MTPMTNIQLKVPQNAVPYIREFSDSEISAMALYPAVASDSISMGRASELLGMRRMDLIRFYGRMGIPFFDESESELEEDILNARSALVQCS